MDDAEIAALEQALSLERFARYLDWAAGDRRQAIALYTLNAQLSECLYIPMQIARNRPAQPHPHGHEQGGRRALV